MITATAFEPNTTDPVWLLLLPGEWSGAWGASIPARWVERRDGLVVCATRHGSIAFAQTAEAAVRAKGARLVEAAHPPRMGPALAITWRDPG